MACPVVLGRQLEGASAQSVGEGGLVREDWPVPEEDEALEPDLLDKIMRPLAW